MTEGEENGGVTLTRDWSAGPWVVFLQVGAQLWWQDFPNGARRWHLLRLSFYVNDKAPGIRVFSLIVGRLRVVWGRS